MAQAAEALPIGTEAAEKQAQQRSTEAQKLLANVQGQEIKTTEDYTGVSNLLAEIKKREKDVEADRKSFTNPLDDLKKRISDRYKPVQEFLTQAKRAAEQKMLQYNHEQERLRQQEEARLREQQRKEQEKLREKADKAEAKGKVEEADSLRQQASMTQGVTVQPETPKTSSTIRKTWKARVTDKQKFLQAVAEREDLQGLVDVNDSALNGMARALKQALSIPGVEVYQEEGITTRT